MELIISIAGIMVVLVIASIVVFSMIRATSSFAPWIPSKTNMVAKAFQYINLKPNMKLVDLGCGDGRILFFANKKFGMAAHGYENAIVPYLIAKIRNLFHTDRGRENGVTIKYQDLFTADLSLYDIIFIYGLPDTINKKLLPKLAREARPGTTLISYNFSLENRTPIKKLHNQWRNVYIYEL